MSAAPRPSASVSLADGSARALASLSLAVLVGLAAGALSLRFGPNLDPVEIVGRPIFLDYSESREQLALVIALVAALLTPLLAFRLPTIFHPWLAPLIAPTLLLPFWLSNVSPAKLGSLFLLSFGLFLAAHLVRNQAARFPSAAPLLGALLTLLPWRRLVDGAIGFEMIAPFAIVLSGSLLSRSSVGRRRVVGLALVASGLVAAIDSVPRDHWPLVAMGLASTLIGLKARSCWTTRLILWTGSIAASSTAFLADPWEWTHWPPGSFEQRFLWILWGSGLALCQASACWPAWWWRLDHRGRLLVTALSLAPLAIVRLARGVLLAPVAAAAVARPVQRPWRWGRDLFIMAFLSLAFFAGFKETPHDEFHDGQILSAVWEARTGRELFSEVFPLRTLHFSIGVILSWFVEPRPMTFHFVYQSLGLLLAPGVYLLSLLVMGRRDWSVAAAVVAASMGDLDVRQALGIWLAASGIAWIKMISPWRWLFLILVSAILPWLGYDLMAPAIASLSISQLIPPRRRPRAVAGALSNGPMDAARLDRWRSPLGAARTLGRAARVTVLMLSVVSLSVALVAGPRGAWSFWELFIEYSRYYPAFYGAPLPWDRLDLRFTMLGVLVILCLWSAAGTIAWPRLNATRRREWLYLLIFSLLGAHRWINRSLDVTVSVLIELVVVLATTLIYFSGRYWRRHAEQGSFATTSRTAGVAVCALALSASSFLQGKVGNMTIAALPTRSAQVRELNAIPLPSSDVVELRLSEGDYLWEMENGLLSFIHRRHNPTRHAIAYCIPSIREQRRAVHDLERHPPTRIVWSLVTEHLDPPIPLTTRYYVISQYLYRHYKPSADRDRRGRLFLEPAEKDWPRLTLMPDGFAAPFDLGWLPANWGRKRWPTMAPDGTPRSLHPMLVAGTQGLKRWDIDAQIDPTRWNYLLVRLRGPDPDPSQPAPVCRVRFAPRSQPLDESDAMLFRVRPGAEQDYLAPIGTSPSWSWRASIDRIEIDLPDEPGAQLISAQLVWFDDLDGDERRTARPIP